MKNPVNLSPTTELIPLLTIILVIVGSFYFYTHFPEQVPMHWNYQGEIDSYSNKMVGAFMIPAIMIVSYLTFLIIPLIDPKAERYSQFQKTYHVFKAIIIGYFALIYFYIGLVGLGYQIPINIVVPLSIGVLFLIIGNYLSKIKPNWFIGIRTPWTLSNEKVWNQTHRFGGKIFVAMGLITILGAFLPNQIYWRIFIVSIISGVTLIMIYSYLSYRKINS
ncbi:MAG: SdpI family protein [Patescibacteria group bacterium]|jgi:uncharacterized membrane protein|nr:SdpI family protein [Patescibacteria group bacterium]